MFVKVIVKTGIEKGGIIRETGAIGLTCMGVCFGWPRLDFPSEAGEVNSKTPKRKDTKKEAGGIEEFFTRRREAREGLPSPTLRELLAFA